MFDDLASLNRLYERLNARDIEAVLPALAPDVKWPNGLDGGWLEGREAVRDYWTRVWTQTTPTFALERFERDAIRRVVVTVRELIHDQAGTLLAEGLVRHAYSFREGLIQRMDILST